MWFSGIKIMFNHPDIKWKFPGLYQAYSEVKFDLGVGGQSSYSEKVVQCTCMQNLVKIWANGYML